MITNAQFTSTDHTKQTWVNIACMMLRLTGGGIKSSVLCGRVKLMNRLAAIEVGQPVPLNSKEWTLIAEPVIRDAVEWNEVREAYVDFINAVLIEDRKRKKATEMEAARADHTDPEAANAMMVEAGGQSLEPPIPVRVEAEPEPPPIPVRVEAEPEPGQVEAEPEPGQKNIDPFAGASAFAPDPERHPGVEALKPLEPAVISSPFTPAPQREVPTALPLRADQTSLPPPRKRGFSEIGVDG